jgi:Ca2+-transporting ATPase
LKLPGQQTITGQHSRLSPQDVADRHHTSLTHGLSPQDASARLQTQGPNELPHDEPDPLWRRFLDQFKEPLILLLLGSAFISAVMQNYEDAISIAIAVTIVVSVAFVQEYRSEKSLEALNQLVPHYAHVIRSNGGVKSESGENGKLSGPGMSDYPAAERASTTISASQLVPGDLVLFHTGDRVPADIRITHSADLSIDESNLTGENEPVRKSEDIATPSAQQNGGGSPLVRTLSNNGELRLTDQTNIAFQGTLVRSGYGQGIVIGTGGDTEFGAISASLQEIESPRTPLQQSMDRLGKDLSYMSFGVIAVIVLIGLWRGMKFLELFQIAVSLAVAAIPEGLPIIVTVTLALGVLRMSKRNAIVRKLPSVETLGSVNIICSDKTGTLTMNHMTASKMWSFGNGAPMDVQTVRTDAPNGPTTQAVLRSANIVNNAILNSNELPGKVSAGSAAVLASTGGDESSSGTSRWAGQPTDVALLDLLDKFGEDDVRERVGKRQQEVPFSSERKWQGVVIEGQAGSATAYIKGALERVITRCDTYLTTQGDEIVLDEQRRREVEQAANAMAEEGLRVLAFGSGSVRLGSKADRGRASTPTTTARGVEDTYTGLTFTGLVGMSDPPRKGVDRSIRRLMAGGVKVIMITGDAETTAVAIAKKLGMPINMNSALGSPVLRGDQLDGMSDGDLQAAMNNVSIFARTSPDHKMKIIRALQARGDVVAMTGDGVNDAPALKKADIGISMGKLGTDVAKEAADMILTDDDFSTILAAIEEGKGIFYNIQNFITFQLSTSVAALGIVMMSSLGGWKNPLNAMQILWISMSILP